MTSLLLLCREVKSNRYGRGRVGVGVDSAIGSPRAQQLSSKRVKIEVNSIIWYLLRSNGLSCYSTLKEL